MPGTEFFGKEEIAGVNEVLETGCLFRFNHDEMRQGIWKAKEMEASVREFTGAAYAHAVSSGSTAVSAALNAAGIGHGDEVIVPPFTYIATVEAVIFAGGLPVFADIDDTLCLSPEGIKKVLTPNTKAVLLVHMCGAAADMDGIMQVIEDNNLILVEDAGQALGAFYKGKSVGLFGKTGAFSFDFFKITTAGEGGVFITNDEQEYKWADSFSDHGHDHLGDNRGMEQHPVLGFNYRISELHAAVGLEQMKRLSNVVELNNRNKKIIKNIISDINNVSFRRMDDPEGDSGTFLNFFLPSMEDAQKVMTQFSIDGVAGCNYWFTNMYHFINQWDHLKDLKSAAPLAIHHFGAPQDYHNLDIPNAQTLIGRLISLGIKASWSAQQAEEFGNKMKASILKIVG